MANRPKDKPALPATGAAGPQPGDYPLFSPESGAAAMLKLERRLANDDVVMSVELSVVGSKEPPVRIVSITRSQWPKELPLPEPMPERAESELMKPPPPGYVPKLPPIDCQTVETLEQPQEQAPLKQSIVEAAPQRQERPAAETAQEFCQRQRAGGAASYLAGRGQGDGKSFAITPPLERRRPVADEMTEFLRGGGSR